ncbi:hypothetical protein pb186bvf_000606 [Paramecium bursaria]
MKTINGSQMKLANPKQYYQLFGQRISALERKEK